MKVHVLFQSRKGNTKKVADAIASVFSSRSEQIPPSYPPENLDILFIGGGLYAGKLDKTLLHFLETFNAKQAKKVVLFSTAGGDTKGLDQMRTLLKAQGANVEDKTFFCKGKFWLFNRKHPSDAEIESARAFAKQFAE